MESDKFQELSKRLENLEDYISRLSMAVERLSVLIDTENGNPPVLESKHPEPKPEIEPGSAIGSPDESLASIRKNVQKDDTKPIIEQPSPKPTSPSPQPTPPPPPQSHPSQPSITKPPRAAIIDRIASSCFTDRKKADNVTQIMKPIATWNETSSNNWNVANPVIYQAAMPPPRSTFAKFLRFA